MNSSFERKQKTKPKNLGEWITPKWLLDKLKAEYVFDLDPCAAINQPWKTAKNVYTISDDGLKSEWKGFVWLNPPYGTQTIRWIKRMVRHNNGIVLIFSRTDTKMFQDFIFPNAEAFLFLRGRLRFCDIKGNESDSAGAPSVLIAFGSKAVKILESVKDLGHLLYNKKSEVLCQQQDLKLNL